MKPRSRANPDPRPRSKRRSESPAAPFAESTIEQDVALATAIARGDRSALDRFHALYSEPLYRFVYYRMGGAVNECEEIVQDTFLAALGGLSRYRGEARLYTWVCGIAKHHIAGLKRQRYRDRLATAIEQSDAEIDAMLACLDRTELPDSVLEREETQDLVGATMATLPIEYQEVLAEKYFTSRPVAEIARRQGKSAKAVESTLTRARLAFRRAFELLTGRLAEGHVHGQ